MFIPGPLEDEVSYMPLFSPFVRRPTIRKLIEYRWIFQHFPSSTLHFVLDPGSTRIRIMIEKWTNSLETCPAAPAAYDQHQNNSHVSVGTSSYESWVMMSQFLWFEHRVLCLNPSLFHNHFPYECCYLGLMKPQFWGLPSLQEIRRDKPGSLGLGSKPV